MKTIDFNAISRKVCGALLFVWLVLLLLSAPVQGGVYYLVSSSIGGGGTTSGGPYTVSTTIGRPEAGAISGGDYELVGGFLPAESVCFVQSHHFARFAEWWLEEDCDPGNNWCGGADLDHNHDVDIEDLRLFSDVWMYSCPPDWPLK